MAMATRCVNPSFEMRPRLDRSLGWTLNVRLKENSAVDFSLRIGATGSWAVRSRLRRAERLFGLEGEIKAAVQANGGHAVYAAAS